MIFDYHTKDINIEKLIYFSKLKRLKILDFGCGKGIWNKENLSNKKIKKIILSTNKNLLKLSIGKIKNSMTLGKKGMSVIIKVFFKDSFLINLNKFFLPIY